MRRSGLFSTAPDRPHSPAQTEPLHSWWAQQACTLPRLAQLEVGVPGSPPQGLRLWRENSSQAWFPSPLQAASPL